MKQEREPSEQASDLFAYSVSREYGNRTWRTLTLLGLRTQY